MGENKNNSGFRSSGSCDAQESGKRLQNQRDGSIQDGEALCGSQWDQDS